MDFGIKLLKDLEAISNAPNSIELMKAVVGAAATAVDGVESTALTAASTVNVFLGDIDKGWSTAQEVLDRVQLGDLVQYRRPEVIYTHFGVYIGNGNIVHIAGDKKLSILKPEEFEVSVEKLLDVSNGRNDCQINNLSDVARIKGLKPFSPDEIVKRAKEQIGNPFMYSLLEANCETFVSMCRYGVAFTRQPESIREVVQSGGRALGFETEDSL